MNTHNDDCLSSDRLREEIGGCKTVVGAKQLRKALSAGRASRVFLAANADPAVTEPIAAMCRACGVSYAWALSMEALGNACGIEVGAAAAAVVQ